jgi:hypothetical protein
VLTKEEQATVARCISSADQDYFVWSGLLGEPFLKDRTLCFYDGQSACIVGQQLGHRNPGACATSQDLPDIIVSWSKLREAVFINYCGPKPVPPLPREEWNLIHTSGPQPWNQEVFLDLEHTIPGRYPWEIRGQLRSATRQGLDVTIEHRESLTHEHIRLLRALAISHHFIASSAGYLTNVVTILRSKATLVFEGRVNNVLAGFLVAHEFFERRPFLIVAAVDRVHRGTSDALHAAMIEYYRERGAYELGMGYAVGEGLYRYKTKWPGASVGESCHQFIWQRLGTGARYRDCLYWPFRLITDAVEADTSIHDPRWLPRYQSTSPQSIRVPVPDIAHLTDTSSGVSALLIICKYYGLGPEDEEEYARDLSLDTIWPDPERIVAAGQRYGLTVEARCPMRLDELKSFLEQRKPVVLLLQAWGEEDDEAPRTGYRDIWEDGHYVVAIGYDRTGVYFEDPSLQGIRGYLSFEDLEERWHSWGRNQEELDHFGAAMWKTTDGPPAYLSRARHIM